jgi:hypothetical protein
MWPSFEYLLPEISQAMKTDVKGYQEFVINNGTQFNTWSSSFINFNGGSGFHVNRGDRSGSYCMVSYLKQGDSAGDHLLLSEYKLIFHIKGDSSLCFQAKQTVHGVILFVAKTQNAARISVVAYPSQKIFGQK